MPLKLIFIFMDVCSLFVLKYWLQTQAIRALLELESSILNLGFTNQLQGGLLTP